MKLKARYILMVSSAFFATLLGVTMRKVLNDHDLSQLPFLIIDAGLMVSSYLAGYLMDEEDPGEKRSC